MIEREVSVEREMCDQECEGELRSEISSLESQLNVYKPLLLALVTTMVCISVWLLVLTLTGKRRHKLRRLLRRDQFITELDTEHSAGSSQEMESEAGEEERGSVTSSTKAGQSVPSVASVGAPRSTKISLPARMTDLYQTYPGDSEGMVVAQPPEIILTRPSISETTQDTADESKSEREIKS